MNLRHIRDDVFICHFNEQVVNGFPPYVCHQITKGNDITVSPMACER